jgi:hypothetical protein
VSVPAPTRNIQEFKTSPMTRLLLALDNWRRRASEASLGLPLGILAVTATFWLVVWLADQALQGSLSPVGVLVRIYGTGAFVMLTLLMVAIAVWMIVQRLGYRDVFFDGQGESAEQQSPAPKWDSSIPDFTGQITKLVSSMDAPASPLPATAPGEPAAPAAGKPPRSNAPANERTPSADQATPSADVENVENEQSAAPASSTAPATKPAAERASVAGPEPKKPAASPAAVAPVAPKTPATTPPPVAQPAASSAARPTSSPQSGKSVKGKGAPGKAAAGKSAPGKKAQAKSCTPKPLLKRKGRK